MRELAKMSAVVDFDVEVRRKQNVRYTRELAKMIADLYYTHGNNYDRRESLQR